jgi:hypothetical protein
MLKIKGLIYMSDIRMKIQKWSESTYGDVFESRVERGRYKPGPAIDMARNVLRRQGLENMVMTGNSTNGLDNMEREVGKFQYVKVFNIISRVADWTPADMVYGTCYLAMKDPNVKLKAQQWGMSEEELISKMCGRALRALPSYLREHDLKCQLEARLPYAEFIQNEALDTVLHADLMMRYGGEDYYFWSFVNTPRSIANFQDKFFGHRQGHVPDGYHVTCPFSLDYCEDIQGWKLYDSVAVRSIARMLDNPTHANYDNVEQVSQSTSMYFQTPKLIFKNDDREWAMEQEELLVVGNR